MFNSIQNMINKSCNISNYEMGFEFLLFHILIIIIQIATWAITSYVAKYPVLDNIKPQLISLD